MVNAVPRNGDNPMGMMFGNSSRTNRTAPSRLRACRQATTSWSRADADHDERQRRHDELLGHVKEPGAPQSESGSLAVSVNGEDIGSVVITNSKGATASGQVTFEDGARPPNMPALRLMAIPTNDISMDGIVRAARRGDSRQHLRTARSHWRPRAAGGRPPAGWMLRSVLVNGEDVTDKGMEFKGTESVTGVEVALTAKVTELSGTVKGPSGAP